MPNLPNANNDAIGFEMRIDIRQLNKKKLRKWSDVDSFHNLEDRLARGRRKTNIGVPMSDMFNDLTDTPFGLNGQSIGSNLKKTNEECSLCSLSANSDKRVQFSQSLKLPIATNVGYGNNLKARTSSGDTKQCITSLMDHHQDQKSRYVNPEYYRMLRMNHPASGSVISLVEQTNKNSHTDKCNDSVCDFSDAFFDSFDIEGQFSTAGIFGKPKNIAPTTLMKRSNSESNLLFSYTMKRKPNKQRGIGTLNLTERSKTFSSIKQSNLINKQNQSKVLKIPVAREKSTYDVNNTDNLDGAKTNPSKANQIHTYKAKLSTTKSNSEIKQKAREIIYSSSRSFFARSENTTKTDDLLTSDDINKSQKVAPIVNDMLLKYKGLDQGHDINIMNGNKTSRTISTQTDEDNIQSIAELEDLVLTQT